MGLNRYGSPLAGQSLKVLVYPLKKGARVYFDVPNTKDDDQTPAIETIQVVPEYQTEFSYK